MTLMGFDAFRDADRAVEQALGANRRTVAVPLEAYRRGDQLLRLGRCSGGGPRLTST